MEEEIGVTKSYKIVDEKDLIAASALLELAKGVVYMVPKPATASSISKPASEITKIKFRFPLLMASGANGNKRKRGDDDHKDGSSRDAAAGGMENCTNKPTSAKKKLQSDNTKAGVCSLSTVWEDADDDCAEDKAKISKMRI